MKNILAQNYRKKNNNLIKEPNRKKNNIDILEKKK